MERFVEVLSLEMARERAEEPLGLVHSDVCGKINSP